MDFFLEFNALGFQFVRRRIERPVKVEISGVGGQGVILAIQHQSYLKTSFGVFERGIYAAYLYCGEQTERLKPVFGISFDFCG